MLKKLRNKFICINMAIVVLMLASIFGLFYFSTAYELKQQTIEMMNKVAENPNLYANFMGRGRTVNIPHFVIQLDSDGQLTALTGNHYGITDETVLTEVFKEAYNSKDAVGELKSYNLRYLKYSDIDNYRIVFADISSEKSTLHNLLRIILMLGAAAILVFLGISVLLARWAIKPVETAWNQQKQFLADASHELKTPLTVIMTNAELLNSGEYTPEECSRFSGSILTMSKQMKGLVENMLNLARIDSGRIKIELNPTSLSEIVTDAILPFEPLFFEQGLMLDSNIAPDIMMYGSAPHIKQVVDILLDNAQKYSSPNGLTTVTLASDSTSRCRLTVSNQGSPIPDDELTNIFKRFVRLDKSRAMNHSYGLGLSIAQMIVEEHHGRIWAESSDGYNSFIVEFPTVLQS